jgi:transposase-like protein
MNKQKRYSAEFRERAVRLSRDFVALGANL